MHVFRFTLPNGHSYRINGESPSKAYESLRKVIGAVQQVPYDQLAKIEILHGLKPEYVKCEGLGDSIWRITDVHVIEGSSKGGIRYYPNAGSRPIPRTVDPWISEVLV